MKLLDFGMTSKKNVTPTQYEIIYHHIQAIGVDVWDGFNEEAKQAEIKSLRLRRGYR